MKKSILTSSINYLPTSGQLTSLLLRILITLSAILSCPPAYSEEKPHLFTKIANPGGDPRVRSIIELPDGRLAFASESGIELFSGSGFTLLPRITGESYTLPGYFGHHHLYMSHSGKYLWIKTWQTLLCIDLDTELYITDFNSFFDSIGITSSPEDIFIDDAGRVWYISGGKILQPDLNISFPLTPENGPLLDLRTDKDVCYLFYKNGIIDFLDTNKPRITYSLRTYPEDEEWKFGNTSLVIKHDDLFYQIKNGGVGGLFRFDPLKKECKKIIEIGLRLNTLAAADYSLLITTPQGMLTVNPDNGQIRHEQTLKTSSGNILASHISTILVDRKNAIWLGTFDKGVFRHHTDDFLYFSINKNKSAYSTETQPSSVFSEQDDGSILISDKAFSANIRLNGHDGITVSEINDATSSLTGEYGNGASFASSNGSLFFNEPDRYDIFIKNDSSTSVSDVKPFISGILVNGVRINPLCSYDGNVILNKIPSRQEVIYLEPYQNFITFEVCSPQVTEPHTGLRYILEGVDREWNHAALDDNGHKILKATYTALSPGTYSFKVKMSETEGSPEALLKIIVKAPWWATWWAFVAYAVILTLAVIAGMKIYAIKTEKRIAAEQREKNLLERIRHLIEEVDRYRAEAPEISDSGTAIGFECAGQDNESDGLSDSDRSFIAKAVEIVEKNLNTPGYSVEQLSKDLCMDRTGLYRKLTSLLDKSPSLFIRDIRLMNAARLIDKGGMTITEISEISGFSSTSYMSKCFQERFGCKPSEYRGRPS